MANILRIVQVSDDALQMAGEIVGMVGGTVTRENRDQAVEGAIKWAHDVWAETQARNRAIREGMIREGLADA